jgi:hypothetical protein
VITSVATAFILLISLGKFFNRVFNPIKIFLNVTVLTFFKGYIGP